MAHAGTFGSSDLLRASVSRVVVDSSFLPQIVIDDPFGPSPAAAGHSGLLALLKPRATFTTPAGDVPVAPFGEPGSRPGRWLPSGSAWL